MHLLNLWGVVLFTKIIALIEPEIAFVLNKDLARYGEYKDEEIDNAIGSAHLALELIQNRFPVGYQATHYEKLADGLSNQGVYLGPKVDVKKAYESSDIHITVKQGGRSQTMLVNTQLTYRSHFIGL
ncbi:hypothetical protein P4S63_25690 [Pseudoalteromonas sp. B193]